MAAQPVCLTCSLQRHISMTVLRATRMPLLTAVHRARSLRARGARPARPMISLLLAFLLGSCGDQNSFRNQRSPAEAPAVLVPSARRPQIGSARSVEVVPKLVRSGELRVQVDKVDIATQRADSIARRLGGYVANMRVSQDDRGRRNAQLVVSVPADGFAETLQALKGLGVVRDESISVDDVTKAYTDLETRLAVKEQTVLRLRRLLADRTGKLSDVLDVEREIGRVVIEVEQLKGERRFYDHQIALSSINLGLFEAGAMRAGATASIGDAFRDSLGVLSTSVAWLVYLVTFLTPWLALAAIGWWVVRLVRSRIRVN